MSDTWEKVLEDVRGKVSRQSFETWFKPARFLGCEGDRCRLELPNRFFKEWFQDHNIKILAECFATAGFPNISFELIYPEPRAGKNSTGKSGEKKQLELADAQRDATRRAFLNPRYTFETFVVGSSNQFSHAACLAVAQAAAPVYNPLFIYGGVGLGKTHLLHAIGHRALEVNPSARLCYISAEQFMNELIGAIRYERTPQFRNKYRYMDYLLIDDIQFIAGKESTQEEFFHTFNSLYDHHKQIVLTSDKMPKEIPELEERLRSRFECGLIADIQPPDLETKVAILKKKAEMNVIHLPDDVALFIASAIKSNIRELEGALIRLGAYASLQGRSVNLDMAKETLSSFVTERTKMVTLEAIKREVAAEFGIKVSDLKSRKRIQSIVLPRQMAMYIARKTTDLSLPFIGREFGGKDHTTVLHSVKRIEKAVAVDKKLRAMAEAVIARLT